MTSIGYLYNQKNTLLNGISDSRNMISSTEDKLSRLQQASSLLSTSISEVESIKSSINGLQIDNTRWKGKKESKFNETYSEYEVSVKDYLSKSNDAKETIDTDIKRYEAELTTYSSNLNYLTNSLDSLESQISQAQKG
ncbi:MULTISPECIES: DUF5082 family protein [unclassified Oceanobacillus]|uniref:YwqH-like family protein n=1 Tax=unclassified Oceanobacillus TaxID=2630292 RepID=UPI001BE576CB|nr:MULTISPECIES: DUF5082 family protein [unclassified Oceanobacillus]MBT2598934.1 DUF5082 family protein [Oceanobacillus sp. ISL-74]MBT2651853.1 DUF5082 family protein [Oceanobacillus sp. ISL-73]